MISDTLHERRLKQKGAVIVTDYYDNGATKTRSSDHTRADDVSSGVILAKKYYLHGNLLHQETEFNPGILYSFVFPETHDGQIQCPNCGGVGDNALFADGCPYCGAFYNMQYQSETLGKKEHSDYVLARRTRLLLPAVLILAVSIALGMFITVSTGRTSTIFDYGKGALIGAIAGGLVYLVYAALRSRAALTSEEMRKKQEQDIVLARFRKDLADNALTMDTFVNCLCLGLRDYYYGSASEKTADIIDFDILGYRDQQCMMQDRNVYVTTDVSVRFVRTDGEKVWSKETQKRIRLKKSAHGGQGAKAGLNITTCPYCGASIDLVEKKCSYCGTAFAYERALNIESVSG